MKLSKMERRLLGCMGNEHVSSKVLMDRLYVGMRRPKTNTISALVSRLRAKGVGIDTLRGKGYRLGSARGIQVRSDASKLAVSLSQGARLSDEVRGMMARYGLDFSVVAAVAMKAFRAIATPAPSYLLTSPPKYGSVDYVKGVDGVYRPE